MLTAKLEDGTTISVVDSWYLDELKKLRSEKLFYCPLCREQVQLKLGTKRQWHFAHYAKSSCRSEYESETMYHLNGKKQLYEWLKTKQMEVALEVYIPIIRQRPDILLRYHKKLYALEYQCAPIDPLLLYKRTQGYKQLGIIPIWILGGNRLKRHSSYTFTLQSFEWHTIRKDQENLPFITYYCPNERKLTHLKQMTPYTKTRMIALYEDSPLEELTLAKFFYPHTENQLPFDHWLTIKKQWRYERPSRYPSKTELFMQQILYRHHIPPSLFPIEAGWATTYHHFIETSPRYWQTFLLLECLEYQPLHRTFSSQMIKSCLQPYINNRLFPNRTIHDDYAWTKAVDGFLFWLCKLNYLEKGNTNQHFKRIKTISLPKSTNEAIHLDRQFFYQSLEKDKEIGHNKGTNHSKTNV